MLFQQSVNKIKIIKICIYLIVLALIFKVGYIQIIDRKNIYDKALESWQRSFPVQANRGKIYDRSGNVPATDATTAFGCCTESIKRTANNSFRIK